MTSHISLTGRTAAARSVEIKAEVRGIVTVISVERGKRVAKGESLVRLAVEDRQAKVEQARALVAYREAEFSASRTLTSRGFNPELKTTESRALLESARAELRRAELDLANTEIKAPFAGVLDRRPVELGNYLAVGDPIATIVDLNPVKVIGYISERHVARLQSGSTAMIQVLGGVQTEGRLSYVSASADTSTRTFRVEFDVPNPDGKIVEGLTSQIRMPVGQQTAYLVSPAVLSLADSGAVGVKLVGAGNKVMFAPVTILDDSPEGIWLGGLPGEISLITVGHEFVADGEAVEPVFETAVRDRS